jgi:hypothetical protein
MALQVLAMLSSVHFHLSVQYGVSFSQRFLGKRFDTDLPQGRCEGRGEPVISGQATRFYTWKSLVAFMIRVLHEIELQPPEEG